MKGEILFPYTSDDRGISVMLSIQRQRLISCTFKEVRTKTGVTLISVALTSEVQVYVRYSSEAR